MIDRQEKNKIRSRVAFFMSEYNSYNASCAQHRNRKYIVQSAILLRPKRIKNKIAEKQAVYREG